jgi:hypothetical protein
MKFCCTNCFHDRFLKKQILGFSDKIGNCNYCNSSNINILNIEKLQDFFEIIIELYEENEDGISLSEILDKDWKIFNLSTELSNVLLLNILKNENLSKLKFINTLEKSSENIWIHFKEELKHNNRYFPNDNNLSTKNLKRIIKDFTSLTYTKRVYRARINTTENIFSKDEMGKPPCKIATEGRANPIGISYLYVASDEKTAISEVRPNKGDIVTVAKIKLPNGLKFLDTTDLKNKISPFEFSDNVLQSLYKSINLLEKFGEELSKPVLPREAHLEYLLTQYLTELVKHFGFDGLIYKSSVGKGYNIVIFDHEELEFLDLKEYKIKNILTKFENI